MHKNNFYISFGIWVAILPFLGIPGSWKNVLVSLSGLFLVVVFLGPIILKKLQPKSKPKSRKRLDNINSENMLSQNPPQNNGLRFSGMENNKEEIKTETEI